MRKALPRSNPPTGVSIGRRSVSRCNTRYQSPARRSYIADNLIDYTHITPTSNIFYAYRLPFLRSYYEQTDGTCIRLTETFDTRFANNERERPKTNKKMLKNNTVTDRYVLLFVLLYRFRTRHVFTARTYTSESLSQNRSELYRRNSAHSNALSRMKATYTLLAKGPAGGGVEISGTFC